MASRRVSSSSVLSGQLPGRSLAIFFVATPNRDGQSFQCIIALLHFCCDIVDVLSESQLGVLCHT